MTLPNQPSIELPLLLELERGGGAVRPRLEFFEKIMAHFPDGTPEDRRLVESNARTEVWQHNIHFARLSLRSQGHLNGGQRGVWQITEGGRRRIRQDLVELGLPEGDVEGFIRGRETLPHRLGPRWRPKPWTARPRDPRRPGPIPTVITPVPSRETQIPAPVALERPTDIRARLLERVKALDDTPFERFCGRLIEALGFEDVQITGRSHDRGVDGKGRLKHLGLNGAFQAKNWRNNQVGSRPVREFRGSIVNRFQVGIYITTSSFSSGAQEEADEPGPPKMVLIDGDRLVDIMIEKGLGVHTVPVTRQEISEEFFGSI